MGLENDVNVHISKEIATVFLNRPKSLNALNKEMVTELLSFLHSIATEPKGIRCIIVKGEGGKAFCSGGDVKQVVVSAEAGNHGYGVSFFRDEYTLDYLISQLAVPYISFIDGIVMGGGVGLAVHGSFRIATERTLFAMPECAIGFFPDVGASYFLQRMPGHLGRYIGLAGARLKGIEVKEAGIATHFIPSESLGKVERALQDMGESVCDRAAVNTLLCSFEASRPQPPALQRVLGWVERHFAGGPDRAGLAAVLSSLERAVAVEPQTSSISSGEGGDGGYHQWALETLEQLRRGSPASLVTTWELLRRSAHCDLASCLVLENRAAYRMACGLGDMWEGVRGALIDRSRPPNWKFKSIDEVPKEFAESLFQPLPAEFELQLPTGSSPFSRL